MVATGLCFHPELCTPYTGLGCGPNSGSGRWQSSNKTNMTCKCYYEYEVYIDINKLYMNIFNIYDKAPADCVYCSDWENGRS